MKKLRLMARGSSMLSNFAAMDAGIRRFVGRAYDPSAGINGEWLSTGKAEEVDFMHEYVQAVKQGDCWAADAETAAICGVPFDPTFGGEVDAKKAAVASSKKD